MPWPSPRRADSEFFQALSKEDKRTVEAAQWELREQRFAAESDFPMLLCWTEAIDRCRHDGMQPTASREVLVRCQAPPIQKRKRGHA